MPEMMAEVDCCMSLVKQAGTMAEVTHSHTSLGWDQVLGCCRILVRGMDMPEMVKQAGMMGMMPEATHSHMSPGWDQVLLGCYRILVRVMDVQEMMAEVEGHRGLMVGCCMTLAKQAGMMGTMAEVLHGHMTLLGLELQGWRSGSDQGWRSGLDQALAP